LAVERGNLIKIHYTAKIGDQVTDSSRGRDPVEFRVGEGQVVQGMDEAVVGLEKGEKKTIIVPPEKAYGQRQEGLIMEIPREYFGAMREQVQEGDIIQIKTKDDSRLVTVMQVREEKVTLDLNHPLAGQTITYELEIVDIKP